jgi:hypothetical protein
VTTAQFVATDPGETPVTARAAPAGGSTNCAAVAAVQAATAGAGPAISAQTANSSAPAIEARAPGTILQLRDANGASVLAVGQSGIGAVAAGAVTATSVAASGAVTAATVAATGALSGAALTATTIAGTGDATITSGDLVLATAGKGLRVKEGANARMGTLTLNGATPVVVSTAAVTATSRIFLTTQAPNAGTPAFYYISDRSVGASFSVTGVALDASTVAWLIVEPA